MWKWLGGCLLVVLVLIVGAMIFAYRTMKESLGPDGSATVTIGATPARVFASLAHGDSVATWMAQGNTVLTSRHGPLVPGDTLRIEARAGFGVPAQKMTWIVREVVPERLLLLELEGGKSNEVIATRRDSVYAAGDSTRVVSRIVSVLLDSMGTGKGKTKSADRSGGFAPELLLSMFKMQAKLELMGLKARIESPARPIAPVR